MGDRASKYFAAAGIAGALSMAFGAAAFVTALIAAANPPVSQYLSSEMNAGTAERLRAEVLLAVVMLCFGIWALAQVILRRPIGMSRAQYERCPPPYALWWVLCVAALAGSAWSLFDSLRYLVTRGRDAAATPQAISMLASSLRLPVLLLAILSQVLFARWWNLSKNRIAGENGEGQSAGWARSI